MKPKLSDIVKVLKQKANTSDTLFVSDPKDKRLKSYQDSSGNYNKRQSDLIRLKEVTDRFNRSGKKYKLKTSRYSDGGKEYIGYTFSTGDPLNPIATNATTEGTSVLSEKYKKPTQPVKYKKSEPKKEEKKAEPVKKEQPKSVEKKKNIYEGPPVYSPGAGSGMPSALIGFLSKAGDTTYIQPEDYERFAVPKYGKAFIESKSKKK